MRKIILFGLLLFSMVCLSQTNVSGGIYSNTTYTLANSPYIVKDNLVLFPNTTLTIEPGVELRFEVGKYLQVRGELIAIGTESNRIVFTTNVANPSKGNWEGIYFLHVLGAKATFKYCDFKYASIANRPTCCSNEIALSYNYCKFENNFWGFMNSSGPKINIDNSEFNNNDLAVTGSDKRITNSTFTNNKYGLHKTGSVDVINATFTNNGTAIYGGNAILNNSTITNNEIGVENYANGFIMTDNTISNNGIGIKITNYSGKINPINNNRICNNTNYNVQNNDIFHKDLSGNCWCTSNQSEIEDKLKDGYDDINLGLFNYTIYDSSCGSSLKQVIKVASLSTNDTNAILDKISVYPNPTIGELNIKSDKSIDNFAMQLFDLNGKLIFNDNHSNFQTTKINIEKLPKGNYILVLNSSGKKVIKKIIKN